MKNIIITCGTSILNSKIINDDLNEKIDEIEVSNNCDLNQKFINYFKNNNFEKIKSIKYIEDFGVEINLLKKVYNIGDNIYIFFSETNGGKIVKDILKGYFKTVYAKKLFGDDNFSILEENFITIRGFKVDEKENFREEAIPSFYEKLENIKSKGYKTIMCPVGGYKALIPYASLYAMVNGWNIKYIYEDSKKLMDLPNGVLTNLSGDLIFKNILDVSIFSNDNLSLNYNFNKGLKLIFGIKNFIEYGKSKDLSEICKELKIKFIKLKDFGAEKILFEKLELYLSNLSDSFDLIRIENIKENIKNILNIETVNLKDILLKNSINFLKLELEKIDSKNYLDWYFKKGRYAESILIMREGLIDLIGKKLNLKYELKKNRSKIENSLGLFKYSKDENRKYLLDYQNFILFEILKGNEKFWEKLTNKRNNFAHINRDESLKSMKSGIKKLYNEYLEIKKNFLL